MLQLQAEVKSRTETSSLIFERPRRVVSTVNTRRLSASVGLELGHEEAVAQEERRQEERALSERARDLRRRIREATLAGIKAPYDMPMAQ